ncbi:MAG: metal-dependent transcriptional regulator [Flavobacteriales bacterium]|nr:metal-dependent transcriptional regulator [Flavobacteriales bacterium]
MTNQAVENYLKCIYSLSQRAEGPISTNAIAEGLDTKPSSVTDMLKKLKTKKLVAYEKYQGASLTKKGEAIAINIIRKHRLWEVFLVEKLGFGWEEVHDIAEQLEHIKSPQLVRRLDEFLDNPTVDPHGDPIPDADGNMIIDPEVIPLAKLETGEHGVIMGVKDSSPSFLTYLQEVNLVLGSQLEVANRFDFDQSLSVKNGDGAMHVSAKVGENLLVKKIN